MSDNEMEHMLKRARMIDGLWIPKIHLRLLKKNKKENIIEIKTQTQKESFYLHSK